MLMKLSTKAENLIFLEETCQKSPSVSIQLMDGQVKKEFLPYKSSGPDESVSDEIKLGNWGNMQHKMTAQNIDDMACDLMNIKSSIVEEK